MAAGDDLNALDGLRHRRAPGFESRLSELCHLSGRIGALQAGTWETNCQARKRDLPSMHLSSAAAGAGRYFHVSRSERDHVAAAVSSRPPLHFGRSIVARAGQGKRCAGGSTLPAGWPHRAASRRWRRRDAAVFGDGTGLLTVRFLLFCRALPVRNWQFGGDGLSVRYSRVSARDPALLIAGEVHILADEGELLWIEVTRRIAVFQGFSAAWSGTGCFWLRSRSEHATGGHVFSMRPSSSTVTRRARSGRRHRTSRYEFPSRLAHAG
jgi:hypothetical protein